MVFQRRIVPVTPSQKVMGHPVQSNLDKLGTHRPIPTVPHSQRLCNAKGVTPQPSLSLISPRGLSMWELIDGKLRYSNLNTRCSCIV